MKKKLLIAVLLLAITFLGVRTTKVLAGNGPSDEFSFITFYNSEDPSGNKSIYEPNTVHNDALEGATYDKSTNTLTLNNVKTSLSLSINEMGEDFKINLVGDNEIQYIIIYGFGYGGNVEFTGNGSLTVNKNKSSEIGIVMAAEGTVGSLTVDDTATLKVYGSENAIIVGYSSEPDGKKVIILKNGQDISENVISEEQIAKMPQNMRVIGFNEGGNAEYQVVTKNGKKYGLQGNDPYYVTKQTIANTGDHYFFDPFSNQTGGNDDQYATLEEIQQAGYTITDEHVIINCWAKMSGFFPLAQNNNGTRYIFMRMFDQNNVETDEVYDITEDKVTLYDGYEYTVVEINNDVQFNSLTEVTEDRSEGYSHTVNLKELEVLPGSDSSASAPEVVTASDNKSDNDKAAAKAVNVLLDAAKNGEEVVGMSAELISAINEAVENGDDVTVELDTTKMELKDVSDEVKAKLEAKIKEEKTLKDSNVLGYFDINLIVKINGDALDEKVTDLKEEMEVKLDVSELVKNLPAVASGKVRQYNVITIHNGEVKVLKGTLNSDNTLSFKTNGFSSYAVTYNDVDADSVNPKTLDNVGSYVAVLVLSIIGFAATLYLKKRNN